MAQLFNSELELQILKIICESKNSDALTLLSTLDDTYFYESYTKEAFSRIKYIAKQKTEIISWQELISDPTISQENREVLKSYDNSYDLNYKIDGLVQNLNDYRKLRIFHQMANYIQDEIIKDKFDIKKMSDNISSSLAAVRSNKNVLDCFTKIGVGSNIKQKLKDLLSGKSQRYIPTGFKGWDNLNQGLPRGKVGIIAATSGGGKSLCANQLALNIATSGFMFKVCIVPLEMSADDMLHRFVANKTELSMSDISKLDENTKKDSLEHKAAVKAYKTFMKFDEFLNNNDCSIELFNPPEDIEMEDLLFTLQPFQYDVIIIDYIGLLKGFSDDNQWRKMGEAVRFAKRWAEFTNTSVMILAQLSEDMILRYSRAMKEHADLLWSWNSGKVNELNGHTIIKVEPQKGRNQAQQIFYLNVDFTKMSMKDATPEEIDQFNQSKKTGGKNNSPREVVELNKKKLETKLI